MEHPITDEPITKTNRAERRPARIRLGSIPEPLARNGKIQL